MGDIKRGKTSKPIRIFGDDENVAADVVIKPDGSQRLLVDSETSISTDLEIIQTFDQDQALDDVTYFDIFSATGVKTVSGFSIEFSDKKVWVRLELDGVEIFDINCEKLKDVLDWNQSPQPQTYVSWNDGLKVFYFTPNFPIKSSTSLKIQARSKTGESKRYRSAVIQVG